MGSRQITPGATVNPLTVLMSSLWDDTGLDFKYGPPRWNETVLSLYSRLKTKAFFEFKNSTETNLRERLEEDVRDSIRCMLSDEEFKQIIESNEKILNFYNRNTFGSFHVPPSPAPQYLENFEPFRPTYKVITPNKPSNDVPVCETCDKEEQRLAEEGFVKKIQMSSFLFGFGVGGIGYLLIHAAFLYVKSK